MMTKISGILPSNARITSTDVQNERPLRPGVPSFGQPMAPVSNPKDEFQRVAVSDREIELSGYGADGKMNGPEMTPPEAKVQSQLQMIDRVSDRFNNRVSDAEDADVAEEIETTGGNLDVRA